MSFRSLMNNKVTVKKSIQTKDAYAGVTETWSIRYSNIPCRIQPMSGKEQAMYGSERVVATHKMFCDAKYKNISAHDEIWENSTRYDIELIREIDKMKHHLEIELRQIVGDV